MNRDDLEKRIQVGIVTTCRMIYMVIAIVGLCMLPSYSDELRGTEESLSALEATADPLSTEDSVLQAEEPTRIWTFANGATAMLQLVNAAEGKAVLLSEKYRQYQVDIALLSSADQEHAQAFEAKIEKMKAPITLPDGADGIELVELALPAQLPYLPEAKGKAMAVGGVMEGEAYAYVSDRLCYTETYRKGKLHGPKIEFYPSGRVYSIRYFRDGVAYGKSATFYENGTVYQSFPWQNGEVNGSAVSYYCGGGIMATYPITDGKRHGKSVHYLPDGDVMGYQYWYNDAQTGQRIFREPSLYEYHVMVGSKVTPLGTLWTRWRHLNDSTGPQR